ELSVVAAAQLFHLALKLFGLAPQHLLLPALLGGLLLVVLTLLLREFLLAPGELLEFLQRLVDGALPLVGGLRHAAALVLVLLGVKFQVEQPFEVARGAVATAATAAAASAAAPERHLDVAE